MGYPHKSHPRETLVLSTHFGDPDARSLAGWKKRGGYQAMEKALGMTPAQIVDIAFHAEVPRAVADRGEVRGRVAEALVGLLHDERKRLAFLVREAPGKGLQE